MRWLNLGVGRLTLLLVVFRLTKCEVNTNAFLRVDQGILEVRRLGFVRG